MPIGKKDSHRLAIKLASTIKTREGEKVSITYSSKLATYLVVIEKGEKGEKYSYIDYIDPTLLKRVNNRL